jgi:phenylalanyl-tRNA synthetase beta chain
LENFLHNLDRGVEEIRFFEIAIVFMDKGMDLPAEEMKLSGILYQERKPSLWKEDAHEFSLVKGAIESLFDDLKVYSCSYVPSQENFLHIGQSADIFLSDSYIGYVGVLAPEIVHKLDLKKQKPNIIVFELDLETILKNISPTIHFVPIPKYPSIKRDIALIVDESVPAGRIKTLIRTFPSEFIEDVSIFDYYKGTHIPEGKKSLAFNIIYRSKERTLRDDDVTNLHDAIVAHILKETKGELRK